MEVHTAYLSRPMMISLADFGLICAKFAEEVIDL